MNTMKKMLQALLISSGLAIASQAQSTANALDHIFAQWEPSNAGVADYHSFSASAPGSGPAQIHAISFSTSEEFSNLWRYYATRCGIDRELVCGNISVLSGTNRMGSYILVERSANPRVRESIFGLRTETYSVSVTLRNNNETPNRPTAGTVVVSLR
jgi:hypothetical protein